MSTYCWLMPVQHTVSNEKALVGAFNQEKALVGAFSMVVKLQTSRRSISSSSTDLPLEREHLRLHLLRAPPLPAELRPPLLGQILVLTPVIVQILSRVF